MKNTRVEKAYKEYRRLLANSPAVHKQECKYFDTNIPTFANLCECGRMHDFTIAWNVMKKYNSLDK